MDFRQGVGLFGIVLAAIAAQLNDAVLNTALPDIGGALDIGTDLTSWLRTLFITGEVIGMCSSPSLGLGFSFRRFALFAIGMNTVPTLLMMFGSGSLPILPLRFLQGLGAGFTIPLLLTIGLRALGPEIRLYGLCVYAMTATLTPNLAATFAALWIDVVGDWHFLFLQVIPFAALAAVFVWWGVPQQPPQAERLKHFDWPAVVLVAIGFGSLSIVVEQGERLDWYNSPLIVVLLMIAVVAIPLLVVRERYAAVPLMHFDLFKRRNFLYPSITLILFSIISLAASQIPLMFLQQVQGYKPLQAQVLTLEVAAPQLVLLPLTAWILDHERIDARWVSAVGYACILIGCIGCLQLNSAWVRDQFYVWQAFQSVGFAFVVMPLLMIATNALKPDDGPFGSALVNTPRAIAEGLGVWVLQLIAHWRGGLHRDRIVDLVGQNAVFLGQTGTLPPAGSPQANEAYRALGEQIERQVATLTTIDSYVVMGVLTIFLLIVLAIVPVRTPPPRIALVQS